MIEMEIIEPGMLEMEMVGQIPSAIGGTTNYNDLSQKPKINDIELIGNKTLDELNIASKDYVEQEIATFDFIKIVSELPEIGLPNRTYLLAKTNGSENDLYDEYIWADGWEYLGTKKIEVDLTDYVKNTDIATSSKLGLVMPNVNFGISVNTNGNLIISPANNTQIDAKSLDVKPITPKYLDYAVMSALTNSLNHEWTEEEQALAKQTLGIVDGGDFELISIDCGSYNSDDIKQKALANASYLVNKLYQDVKSPEAERRRKIYLPLCTYHNSFYTGAFIAGKLQTSLSSKPTSIVMTGQKPTYALGETSTDYSSTFQLSISGKWEGETFVASNISTGGPAIKEYIATDNTTVFLPSKDYHPVTKIYVDEQGKYDWAGNNILSYVNYKQYNVGDLVYYAKNKKYYRCIVSHNSSYQFKAANWQELTEDELKAMERVSKDYIDNKIGDINTILATLTTIEGGE